MTVETPPYTKEEDEQIRRIVEALADAVEGASIRAMAVGTSIVQSRVVADAHDDPDVVRLYPEYYATVLAAGIEYWLLAKKVIGEAAPIPDEAVDALQADSTARLAALAATGAIVEQPAGHKHKCPDALCATVWGHTMLEALMGENAHNCPVCGATQKLIYDGPEEPVKHPQGGTDGV